MAMMGTNSAGERNGSNMSGRRLPNPARRFGRLILSTCQQATTHSVIDRATTKDAEGNTYRAVAIVRPWRRNEHGEYPRQRALVIGWRKG